MSPTAFKESSLLACQQMSFSGLPPIIGDWSQCDVRRWLETILCARFPSHSFSDTLAAVETTHLIDGRLLLDLSDAEWQEAIPSIGARKVVKHEVAKLASCKPSLAVPNARSPMAASLSAGRTPTARYLAPNLGPLSKTLGTLGSDAGCESAFNESNFGLIPREHLDTKKEMKGRAMSSRETVAERRLLTMPASARLFLCPSCAMSTLHPPQQACVKIRDNNDLWRHCSQ